MPLTLRLTIAAILVAAVHFGVRITHSGLVPRNVELPDPDPRSLPLKLGEWTGEEREVNPRIDKATGAEYTVNRTYRGPQGQTVSMHIAVITKSGVEGVHHFPQYCYRGSGYQLVSMERRQLRTAAGDAFPVSFSLWGRDDGPIAVVYWYQFGDEVFFNINEFRQACRRRWGSQTWPPVIKVLLSTPADSQGRSPAHLEEFAELVAQQTRKSSG